MARCIREPCRTYTQSEDALLRSVLSVLSAEEMAMQLVQPSGIGRRPTNVSAESMLITPDLKAEDLYLVPRHLTYTPPPRGYVLEGQKPVTNGRNNNGSRRSSKPNGREATQWSGGDYLTYQPSYAQEVVEPFWPAVCPPPPAGARPIVKSYQPQQQPFTGQ